MYVCTYISGNSRWRSSRSTVYKARNHLCSYFAVYLSNEDIDVCLHVNTSKKPIERLSCEI